MLVYVSHWLVSLELCSPALAWDYKCVPPWKCLYPCSEASASVLFRKRMWAESIGEVLRKTEWHLANKSLLSSGVMDSAHWEPEMKYTLSSTRGPRLTGTLLRGRSIHAQALFPCVYLVMRACASELCWARKAKSYTLLEMSEETAACQLCCCDY